MKVRARRNPEPTTVVVSDESPAEEKPRKRRGMAKGTKRKSIGTNTRSREEQARNLMLRQRVFAMRTQCISFSEIGATLKINRRTVATLWEEAFQDFSGDTNHRIMRQHAEQSARYERLIQALTPEAYGGRIQAPDGTIREIEPNAKIREELRKVMRDYSLHQSGAVRANMSLQINNINTDTSAPVQTTAVSAMEAARLVRENFPIKMGHILPRKPQGSIGEVIDVELEPENAANEEQSDGSYDGEEDIASGDD